MFNSKNNECVGFESRWKVKKVSSVESTQTSEFSTSEAGTSTVESTTTEVQTDPVKTEDPIPDDERLAEWLKRIYPSVKRELEKASTSKAFKGYQLLSDKEEINCKVMQTVKVSQETQEGDAVKSVSTLDWNSSGRALAVSCTLSHTSWCYHEGVVNFYMLNSENLVEKSKRNLHRKTTTSCVTALQFHSSMPSVIAVGLFSGEILIWNIDNEEAHLAQINGHELAVNQLSWINEVNSSAKLLASSSLDGMVKLWNFNTSSSTLTIKDRFKIKSPLVTKVPRSGNTPATDESKKLVRGVIGFDFSTHVPDMFVVGAEGGLIAQCSVLGAGALKGNTEEEPLHDPVFKCYQPHSGEIYSISFSPHRKDMFLTCGSEGEVRVYIIGQEEPAQVIFPQHMLYRVSWVPYEEKIIVGCGKRGLIEVFNLTDAKQIENITEEKGIENGLHSMQINKVKTNIVAVGAENGNLQLWNVPWNRVSASIS